MPATLKVVSQVMSQALPQDTWQLFADDTRYPPLEWCPDGMAQRWLVVASRAARARAEATLNHAKQREDEALTTPLFHLQAQRLGATEAAQEALVALAQRWQYHRVESAHLTPSQRYAGRGRPTPSTPLQAIAWHIQAHVPADDATIAQDTHAKACDVLGTNSAASE
jgi:hypothetical protein